ncbi:histidine kinase [Niabella yanshanensis]|uniref:Histidine kinase n=1 Tax=Niabella yanshanensis TaxID=577386 RepID=A0ABZ0W1I6_9BACT|nr:histidine kinase [Niabella yanshanensis]WQD36774.1 histidine kinase [Niabella yanshanensis]
MRSVLKVESTKDFRKVHIAFWVFWLAFSAVLNFSVKEYFTPGLFVLRNLLVNICPFYSVYVALKLSKQGDRVNYWLRIVLLLSGMALSFGAHWLYFTELASGTPEMSQINLTVKMLVASFAANYLYFFLFGLMFYFFEDLVQKREEAKLAENKIHAAETAFLRAQINPHFLLNTLNFFYASAALGKSRELAAGILKLSDIMRFALTESSDKLVLLRDEMRFIQAYIELNQMRFENKLSIEYVAPADDKVGTIKVVPLVLITLVENAFKHGELHEPEHPVKIALELNRAEQCLKFYVKNKKTSGPKERGHGIGLENTISRLQNEYGNNYRLSFNDAGNHYAAELVIQEIKM